jgi:hypothetical protein
VKLEQLQRRPHMLNKREREQLTKLLRKASMPWLSDGKIKTARVAS